MTKQRAHYFFPVSYVSKIEDHYEGSSNYYTVTSYANVLASRPPGLATHEPASLTLGSMSIEMAKLELKTGPMS
jgi:hypothetical protein